MKEGISLSKNIIINEYCHEGIIKGRLNRSRLYKCHRINDSNSQQVIREGA